MKSKLYLILMFHITVLPTCAQQQDSIANKHSHALLQRELGIINHIRCDAFTGKKGNLATIMEYYTNDAVVMPEHDTTLYTKVAIEDYYTQWLSAATINGCSKTIYEVKEQGDYVFEIGTFTVGFTLTGKTPYTYDGKYFCIWLRKDYSLHIISEIWGANAPFNDADFPQITNKEPVAKQTLNVPKNLEAEVRSRNKLIGQLVTNRKGAEHANLFMPDAIYLTYYTPMLIGMPNIKPYFTEHEKPGEVTINSLLLDTGKIIDLGSMVIEHGFYKVDYTAGSNSGTVKGKSINLWKRDQNGTLMMYRQMVNHD